LGWLGYGDIDLKNKLQSSRCVQQIPVDFIVSDSPGLVITLVTIPFLMFFFIKDALTFKKELIRIVPNRFFEFSLDLIHKMDQQLGNYLRAISSMRPPSARWRPSGSACSVALLFYHRPLAGLAIPHPYVGPFAGGFRHDRRSEEHGDLRQAGQWPAFLGISWWMISLFSPWPCPAACISIPRSSWSPAWHAPIFLDDRHAAAVPITGFIKVVITESAQTLKQYRFNRDSP
jgi:hypothetical protein